jgi:hypothetical protein
MMAGATTKTSTAIGAVTAAQIARILVKEYCTESAGASTRAGNDCVSLMLTRLGRAPVPHIVRRPCCARTLGRFPTRTSV